MQIGWCIPASPGDAIAGEVGEWMAARLVGTWTIVELTGRGTLRLGTRSRLFLEDLRGSGGFAGELRTGPLRLPLRVSFGMESEDSSLLLRPKRGAALLRVLSPLVPRSAPVLMRGGSACLDLTAITGGAITLAPVERREHGRDSGGIQWI